jgi:hypothetical protein
MRRTLLVVGLLLIPIFADCIEITPADSEWKLDIYGVILANAYWNSEGVVGSDVPLWVVSSADVRAGDTEFSIAARQTRFGFRIKPPDLGNAKVNAVVESDFFGGFPVSGQAPSFSNPRLRLAFVKLEWEKISFTAGQDWIILAPLNPTTLAHFAVVGLAASGNLWLRYPQIRIDSIHPIGTGKLHLTGGIVRPVSGSDIFSGGTLTDTAGAGERSGMPFWQGRFGYSRTVAQNKTISFGVSAHYGQEDHRFSPSNEQEIDSWAVAGDFLIPIGSAFSIQGEIFSGSNLDSFQGGINQGFETSLEKILPAPIIPLDTSGGWIQLSATPLQDKNLSFHLAYGVDDPKETGGFSGADRVKNSTWMASAMYKFSKHFQTAVEYNHITTEYVQSGKNSASVINVAIGLWF